MTIDLLTITPHQVSRDLRGKIVCVYSEPKVGKSTFASKFPDVLLVAFEKGYNFLSGVKVAPVQKWSEFKKILKQLEKPEVKAAYGTIAIDTADLAFDACEKFICQREGVDQIGDIPYGAGYKMLRKEFDDALRSIPMQNYGLVNISHSMVVNLVDEQGVEYTKIVPTLPKAARHIVLSMSDIIAYAKAVQNPETGETKTVLFLRGSSQFEAGSRFKHAPNAIPFTYDALVDTIAEAIEKEAEENGEDAVTDKADNAYKAPEEKPFAEVKSEIDQFIATAMDKVKDDKDKQQAAINVIKKTIENHLGKGKTLKDATDEQRDHLELILDDLKAL